ncbi:MAG TPA: transposase [Ktedonobacteraceae bacterium]|nr:transposase [Ktedonobacteraceae bacterium]
MLTYEYKIQASPQQYAAIEQAIRTTQFIRNKCLRLWMDTPGTSKNDLQCYCAVLAQTFPFAACLNSQARQVAADRAWNAISRFYDNCRKKKPGKKGYPRFQHDNRSVEYKTTGWMFDPDGKHLRFTDGCGIGRVRLIGNHKQRVATFPLQQVKRVRLLKRADGYYVQFCVQAERNVKHVPTGAQVGIDLGLKAFYTDSNGNTVANPRFLRQAEKKLKRLHRRLSRTQKQSAKRRKARQRLAKASLKVQRQREDFARKTANALITSHDLVAFEDLKIANLVKNHHLAKAITDAAWGRFLAWVRYYGVLHNVPIVAVAPHWTSQQCSGCGTIVKKSLSERTHRCVQCGLVMDRDENAARNILAQALQGFNAPPGCTEGHSGTGTPRRVRNASGQTASTRRAAKATGKRAE